MQTTGNIEYERIFDKATFAIRGEEDGSYSITCQVNKEKFGWPVPGPVPAVQGLPDQATAEAILMRLRQMDIDAHAQLLFQFKPQPVVETHVDEPSYKEKRHQ